MSGWGEQTRQMTAVLKVQRPRRICCPQRPADRGRIAQVPNRTAIANMGLQADPIGIGITADSLCRQRASVGCTGGGFKPAVSTCVIEDAVP